MSSPPGPVAVGTLILAADRLPAPGSPPYILRWSVRISRRRSLSGEMSVNSFSAENALSILPAFCIRSAYCTKFCWASVMKPFAAYSFASFRYVACLAGALRSTLLHMAMALLWNPSSAYLSTA